MATFVTVPTIPNRCGEYPNIHVTDKFDATKHQLTFDRDKYPYINDKALEEYVKLVNEKKYETDAAHQVYETVEPMRVCLFKPEESAIVRAIYVCKGGYSVTLVIRNNFPFTGHFTSLQKKLKAVLHMTDKMGEHMPQHIGTHCPGFKKMISQGARTTHRHWYGDPLTLVKTDKIVDVFMDYGCLGDFTVIPGIKKMEKLDRRLAATYKKHVGKEMAGFKIAKELKNPAEVRIKLFRKLNGAPVNNPTLLYD